MPDTSVPPRRLGFHRSPPKLPNTGESSLGSPFCKSNKPAKCQENGLLYITVTWLLPEPTPPHLTDGETEAGAEKKSAWKYLSVGKKRPAATPESQAHGWVQGMPMPGRGSHEGQGAPG